MTGRRTVWGLAALAAYLAAAVATFQWGGVVLRPLYDGLGPPIPYRWMSPPPELADTNEAPQPGEGTIDFDEQGSLPNAIATADGQAQVVFRLQAVPPRDGEQAVRVRLEPLDPGELPEPPEDLQLDGNAYRIEATYDASGEAIELERPVAVVLRYPVHAESLMRLDDTGWMELPDALPSPASMQMFGDADALGVFAAAGPPRDDTAAIPWWAYAIAGAGLAVAVLAILVRPRDEDQAASRAEQRRVEREE